MPDTKSEDVQSSKVTIKQVDHVVFTVKDPTRTATFYHQVIGMIPERFGPNKERLALKFGNQKLNLHQAGAEYKPHATHPTPGSVDICFITNTPLLAAMQYVREQGVKIEEGPVQRTGANGPIQSFYFRDPDGNLIEVANYPESHRSSSLKSFLTGEEFTSTLTWAISVVGAIAAARFTPESSTRLIATVAVSTTGFISALGYKGFFSKKPISDEPKLEAKNNIAYKKTELPLRAKL